MRTLWLALALLFAVSGSPPTTGAEPAHLPLLLIADDRMPLAQVLKRIEARFPGRALNVRLRKDDEQPVYRVKWLGEDGKVREVTADARSGKIVAVR